MPCFGGKNKDNEDGVENDPIKAANINLQFAASTGDNQKVRDAIKAGADVNAPEEIASGVKFAVKTGDYPLHMAAEAGKVETVHLLFYAGVQGANPEYKNLIGSTALHRAASQNHPDVVKELITLGASIHATNKIGNTALHIASYCGFLDVAKVLLDAGASAQLEVRNKVEMTPIDYARKLAMKDLLFSYMKSGRPE